MQLQPTFAKAGQWLQDPPPEGSHGVLDAGAQTEHALEVGLLQQQLSVRAQLVGSAQQGSNAMDKLRNEASVGVVCLAVVISHDLECGIKTTNQRGQSYCKPKKNMLEKYDKSGD